MTIHKQQGNLQCHHRQPAAGIHRYRPDEFGAVCAFLCSQQAAYITAQNVLMDGGLYPGAF